MKTLIKLLYLFIISLFFCINLYAQDGTLDNSFGDNGLVELFDTDSWVSQHKALPNNQSLISLRTVLFKTNEDGSLDNTFGANGIVDVGEMVGSSDSIFFRLKDFDITADGKIVVGGVFTVSSDYIGGLYLTIIQLNSNGDLDAEFAENGIMKKKLNCYSNEGIFIDGSGRLRITPNNKIIVTIVDRDSLRDYGGLIRLNSNGSMDNSFGTDGVFKHDQRTYGRNRLAVDMDGNIFYGDDIFIDKVFDTGILDTTFGNAGYFSQGLMVRDIDFQSDGKIIGTFRKYNSTTSTYSPIICRISQDGVLDSTFAVDGMKEVRFSTNDDILNNTIVMPEDDIISGGYSYDEFYHYDVILSKLTSNGGFEETFGDSGKVLIDLYGDSEDRAAGLVVNSINYDITVSAMREMPDSSRSIVLARFLNSKSYINTHVSGDVSGTWQPGTVYVDGDITIPQDQSLIIKPGTNVYFTGEYKFDIYGQLVANGTRTDSIFFFSDSLGRDENYNRIGHWWGVGFKNLDLYQSRKSELSYCDFKYALSKEYNNYEADLDADSIGAPIRLYNSSNVSLNHITISECDAYFFGNLHLIHSSPDISNISIKNKRGRIYIRDNSNPSLKDITLSEAGIIINDSSPIIEHLLIENYIGSPLIGHNFDGAVKNSAFKNNTYYQKDEGAAFTLNEGSAARFENVLFEGNQQLYSSGYYGFGGAGFIRDSSPRFINCQFIENVAYGGGGAIAVHSNDYSQRWISTFDNCLFIKNNVIQGAGAITTSTNAAVHLTNCTIADNTASMFAAIDNTGGSPNIITNTIIYGNGPNFDQQMTTLQSSHQLEYNIIQGEYYGKDTTSSNIHDVDPMFRDTSTADYHLQSIVCGYLSDSPAIDAGHPDSVDTYLDCSAGLGTVRADMGYYGGRYADLFTAIESGKAAQVPQKFALKQNYPNPFNPTTTIRYQLSAAGHVQLTVYNMLGQKVQTLVNGRQGAGRYSVTFNAAGLSSGIYYYKLQTANGYNEIKRMILLK